MGYFEFLSQEPLGGLVGSNFSRERWMVMSPSRIGSIWSINSPMFLGASLAMSEIL